MQQDTPIAKLQAAEEYITALENALSTLEDFASTVGGSSSFWEEVYTEFDQKTTDAMESYYNIK